MFGFFTRTWATLSIVGAGACPNDGIAVAISAIAETNSVIFISVLLSRAGTCGLHRTTAPFQIILRVRQIIRRMSQIGIKSYST